MVRGCANQAGEVLERAQVGIDGLVAALRPADRPRAAGIIRARALIVVRALAVGPPDRVDGWQVQHVEPHPGHVRETGLDVGEGAVAAPVSRGRSWKHLVPRAEASSLPVHLDRQLRVVGHREPPVRVRMHQLGQLVGHGRLPGRLRGSRGAEGAGERPERSTVRPVRPRQGLLHQKGPREKLHRDVLAGFGLRGEVPSPRAEPVHPPSDRVEVPPQLRDRERAAPPIVPQ